MGCVAAWFAAEWVGLVGALVAYFFVLPLATVPLLEAAGLVPSREDRDSYRRPTEDRLPKTRLEPHGLELAERIARYEADLADEIEALAAAGFSQDKIIERLGRDHPELTLTERRQAIRAVRTARGIPPLTDRAARQAWLQRRRMQGT